MATPPPPQSGQGFGNFPQQQQQAPQPPSGGAQGFGPPPGLPAAPGLPASPGLPSPGIAQTLGTPAVPPPGAGGAPRGGNLRRNAVWAFVGALLASAGWATAVATVPSLASKGDNGTAPLSVRNYKVVDDLCTVAKLGKLSQIYTTPDDTPYHNTTKHESLDSMYCSVQIKRSGAGSADYASVYSRAELHKAVNSAPEFTAAKSALQQQKYQITEVPGLGDEAYLAYRDDPSKSTKGWHNVSHELEVRDGALTFYLSWSDSYEEGKSSVPDHDKIKDALLADGREILKGIGGNG